MGKKPKQRSNSQSPGRWHSSARSALLYDGESLSGFDAAATPGFDGRKKHGKKMLESRGDVLGELQEKLFAGGRSGDNRSVLLVIQGMDTAGKGGIVRHVIGHVDPQGVDHASFGAPTRAEKRHDFLWRVKKKLPRPGQIGVFDRSHYEDVLIARVKQLVPKEKWKGRYKTINDWEKELVAAGTTIIKVALFVSLDEQKGRLRERLERPDKHWKYDPGDIGDRKLWPEYRQAYQTMLDKTSTSAAPWYVIPADRKWFSRLAVAEILIETLTDLDLQWPAADFDASEELERLKNA